MFETTLDGTLYKIPSSEATVIADGYGIYTNHDGCLVSQDGVIHAEKFGIQRTSPSAASRIDEWLDKSDGEYYSVIEECILKIYTQNDVSFVPTTIDIDGAWSDFAVLDNETDIVYRVNYDARQQSQLVLSEIGKHSFRHITPDEIESKSGERYIPLVEIQD